MTGPKITSQPIADTVDLKAANSTQTTDSDGAPAARESVLIQSVPMPKDAIEVRGYDFSKGLSYDALFNSYISVGFQGTAFGQALEVTRQMVGFFLTHL